jgi:hypothetical protein
MDTVTARSPARKAAPADRVPTRIPGDRELIVKKNTFPKTFGSVCALVGLLGIGTAQGQGAEPFDWNATLGMDYSDNILRTVDNEESATTAYAGLRVNGRLQRPRYDASLKTDLSYHEYLDSDLTGEVVGGLDGALNIGIVPERFFWLTSDQFGQVKSNTQAADTPLNRQNINVFSTGPQLLLPLGGRTQVQLDGTWSDVYYEDADDADSTRTRGALSLNHNLSDATSLSVSASRERVELDVEAPAIDRYDVDEYFVGYNVTGRRTTLNVNLGYNQLDDGIDTYGGTLIRLNVTRKIATRSSVGLQLGREYSDSADVFQRVQMFGGVLPTNPDGSALADPFRSDYAYLSWQTDARRMEYRLFARVREERHERLPGLDRDFAGLDAEISRRVTSSVVAYLNAAYVRDELSNVAAPARHETSLNIGVNWQAGQRFGVAFDVGRSQGRGNVGETRKYTENRAFLGFTYGRGGR